MGTNNMTLPHDFTPGKKRFLTEVLEGLQNPQKEISSKYLYDKRGASLFERISRLKEYYIPRIEASIIRDNISDIAKIIGSRALIIEYGAGDCKKIRFLLDHLEEPVTFIPIDISRAQLKRVTSRLGLDYPDLDIVPVCADYTRNLELPRTNSVFLHRVIFFPGSTISNFAPVDAVDFLRHMASKLDVDDVLLIGVDLKKDENVLYNAYNDSKGVTADFNLNLLKRINRELNGDFELSQFQHYAPYNNKKGRIEMYLVSLKEQVVHLGNVDIYFKKGESIWTESSYKYSIDGFSEMASRAGLMAKHVWTDTRRWFSVYCLVSEVA